MKKHGGVSIAVRGGRRAKRGRSIARFGSSPLVGAEPGAAAVDVVGQSQNGGRISTPAGRRFRNFSVSAGDRVFRYKGEPVDHTPELRMALRVALRKLAYALEGRRAAGFGAPDHLPDDKAGRQVVAAGDNPNLPSGYVYLLQLVAHDIVQSASSLAQIDDAGMALENNRSAALRLESIYGGGPENSPLLYDTSFGGDEMAANSKAYLRLGPLNTGNAFVCPFRDLARIDQAKAIADVKKRVMDPVLPAGGPDAAPTSFPLPDVIVGDNRNDDHPILSQLTVVFHLLHNSLVKWAASMPLAAHARNSAEGAFDCYYFARIATTLIFRNILRGDVLKRLLHPRIYELFNGPTPPRVDEFDGRIPLELTHGALRACHAMLREQYLFNERSGSSFILERVLERNSIGDASGMPLPELWAVAWSNFFDIDPANLERVNLSARLRPRYDRQTQSATLFKEFDELQKPGLAYRDLLSSALAGMWSAPALMSELAAQSTYPELAEVFKNARLSDVQYREAVFKEWFSKTALSNLPFEADEAEALAHDPPMPFFLMFEAMDDPDCRGLRLGPLGSTIVGSVIFGILDADPIIVGGRAAPLNEQLQVLHQSVFGNAVGPLQFPMLDTMADLIRFVAQQCGLDSTRPRFI